MSDIIGTIHLAGPIIGARQECFRCGHVLSEYTGAEAFRIEDMPDPEDPTTAYSFWPPGKEVLTIPGVKMLVESLRPDRDTSDEVPCQT